MRLFAREVAPHFADKDKEISPRIVSRGATT
jgi:hypothetical protein